MKYIGMTYFLAGVICKISCKVRHPNIHPIKELPDWVTNTFHSANDPVTKVQFFSVRHKLKYIGLIWHCMYIRMLKIITNSQEILTILADPAGSHNENRTLVWARVELVG